LKRSTARHARTCHGRSGTTNATTAIADTTAAWRKDPRRAARAVMKATVSATNRTCSTRNRQATACAADQAARRARGGTSSSPGSSQKPAATRNRYGVSPLSEADSIRSPDAPAMTAPAIAPAVGPNARTMAAVASAAAAAPSTHQAALRRPKPPLPPHNAATR
jgi:hypothetical protein